MLQMAKDGTGTDVISFWLYMECAGESGVSSTYENDTRRFHFMTVPADFEASWPGNTYCWMELTHYNTYNGSSNRDTTDSSVHIYCND